MEFPRSLIRYTLRNVVFGITLMVAIALYVAVGSGFPSVREYFEMNELQFFNAWPLKALMILLCANLAVVTWNRIPLTPPRYGVWCIHSGIITLIIGTSLYYHFKVEGRILIPVNHSANLFYDSAERALYIRPMDRPMYGVHALPSLPRFGDYPVGQKSARFDRPDLTHISQFSPLGMQDQGWADPQRWLGASDPITFDIVGYYPNADISQEIVDDPASTDVGIELRLRAADDFSSPGIVKTLTSAEPTLAKQVLLQTWELEHRHVSEASLSMIREAAGHLFHLTAAFSNRAAQALDVNLGQTYALGDSGYTLTLDSFNPQFPMSGTHEIVQTLTIHVVAKSPAPAREFWRMILAGKPLQTDFKMDPASTAPMAKGNRQTVPLDPDLMLGFSVDDPASLLPGGGEMKDTYLTAGDQTMVDIHTSYNAPPVVRDLSEGLSTEVPGENGSKISVEIHRRNHVKVLSRVIPRPLSQRRKDDDESGIKQVAVVRVTAGSWSQDVDVPFNPDAAPDPQTLLPTVEWEMGIVHIPHASSPLQIQLGFQSLGLPAKLTLKKFELIRYPGGKGQSGPFRDFRSTLEITDLATGEHGQAVTSNNTPIYYDGGRWLFFQAGYDPDGQASTIGVGNRPGVMVMTTGCVMIVLGLLYAFYVKPIVIRRMKAAALERFASAGRKPPREAMVGAKAE